MSRVNVEEAKSYLQDPDHKFPGGCTEFVAKLLGKPQKKSSQWTTGEYIGTDFSSLTPGDIVGWPVPAGQEHGHVAVYIGEANLKFIDVPGMNKTIRALKRGYGDQGLYKMSY